MNAYKSENPQPGGARDFQTVEHFLNPIVHKKTRAGKPNVIPSKLKNKYGLKLIMAGVQALEKRRRQRDFELIALRRGQSWPN